MSAWYEVIGSGYQSIDPTDEEALHAEAEFLHDEPLGDTTRHSVQFARHLDGHLAGICPVCNALMVRAAGDGRWQLLQAGRRRRTARGYRAG